ncbi:alpha/beta fold hydrolase [Nocardioides maradonensis]
MTRSDRYVRLGAKLYAAGMKADAKRAGLRTAYADVDGLRMAYHRAGPVGAPVIVMVHGYSADRQLWSRFARRFVDRYDVVIPDLAGHGDTPFVAGADYSAPAQAARVAGLLDNLGIERAHLIGNSMGGFVVASFARAYPERTRSICLSDAAGVKAPVPSDAEVMLAQGTNPFLFRDPLRFYPFFAMTMAKPPYAPRIVKAAMAQQYVDREPQLAEIFDGFYERDLLDDHLAEITAPTLVMWGDLDRLVAPSAAGVWAEGIPNAISVTYPGIGHMPMVEIPGRAAADYAAFLRSVG